MKVWKLIFAINLILILFVFQIFSKCGRTRIRTSNKKSQEIKSSKIIKSKEITYDELEKEEEEPQWESHEPKRNLTSSSKSDKIISGSYAQPGQFPWIVSLQAQRGRSWYHICGATIIAPNWLLTAAHCKTGFRTGRILAGCLKHNINNENCQQISISSRDFISHPKYSYSTIANDIALLKLPKDLKLSNDNINQICLPSKDFSGNAFVAGWGNTSPTGTRLPRNLMKAKVQIRKSNICSSKYGDKFRNSNICAGGLTNGKDSCYGDSGGPLMALGGGSWQIIGIVSYGMGCGQNGYPGVYTRVTSYLDWIDKYLNPS